MTAALTVRVPATSANVGAGFDALGVALSLHLHATVGEDRGADRVVTDGEGADELAVDDTNLVWTSFAAFCAHVGAPVPDVTIHLRNDVPLERGLGSSSAAIVAGLGLARAHLGAAVGDRELVALATDLEGHPDNVAPAGVVVGRGTVGLRVDPSPRGARPARRDAVRRRGGVRRARSALGPRWSGDDQRVTRTVLAVARVSP
ncbi:MAG: hypothetical protein LC789_18615 [Actinobacteria bacterium]|nr:hypothetical protein [Actinomycetota bacterium]